MEWHDPDCRRMDPVPFDNNLWTCQACGTVGSLRFLADSLGECATPEPASNQDTHKESIKRLSWPAGVEYSQEPFSQDMKKTLCLVKANYPKVATGVTYRVGQVSDAYGRELLPVIYPMLTGRSHIRLLELLPAPREKALEGRFQVVDIEQMPAYEALSYTWADGNNDASLCQRIFIGLGNRALPITRNCHQALSRLRRKTESLLIWVDAICINQSDLGERSDQVAMMGTIFSQAAEVHGYVGEDPDNIEGGEFGAITLLKDELQSSKLASRHFKDNAEEALGRLLTRPNANSRDVFIKAKLHNAEVPWWLTKIGWIGAQSKGDMLELLSATALCKMTDMRDKIFGLLGLANGNEVNVLKANYKLTVREVYIGTALYLIQQRNWHNVIELAESMTNLRLRSKYGIPSWVPLWDLQETAYNSVDLSERLGEIELGWKVRLNRDPFLSSMTGSTPSQQFRTIPFLTKHDTAGNFSPTQSFKAVDGETGCLITAGYEIAVLYYASFMSGDKNGTVDDQYRETNYHMLSDSVFLATSGPMSTFRDKPERMLGLSDILSLVKISGCRMPFLANKHVRDGDSVTYELLYPCASAIIYPIGKDHLYSNHPDFDRICTLEVIYPLTLEIIKFLYHWRRIIKLRSQSPGANQFDSSSLKDEEIRVWNFFVRHSVLTGAKVSGFSGERQEWRLELEASPGWKMNRQSALVDNLLSEFAELMNFWNSEAFDAVEKLVKDLDIVKSIREIQHWHRTLGRFSASFCGRGWKGDADAQRSLTGAKLRTLKKAHEFLFKTFSQLFPTGAKKETMFLMPMDFGEISQLSEEWLGGYRDEEEAVAIMEQRWMNCTSLFLVLAESAELRGEARRVLEGRREMSRMFGIGRESERIVIE
ncbi:heterokaryon incompatibility het-6 [Fusarium mexicanum]|uniref:Heterokaryon incompatibility het-6 n=1 Tax=Fusarium mexicanum TaxID=751941 RepID=A0A8H5J681_9HYPO|nr:heterokaryon incompatibility het-6 [Fusarium mexicanum]